MTRRTTAAQPPLQVVRIGWQPCLDWLAYSVYLKDAMEQVLMFGKGKTPDKEGGAIKVKSLLVSNETMTES